MAKNVFAIKGNICGKRIMIGRVLRNPPLTQEGLAIEMQLNGMEMTQLMISRIEQGKRHVIDAELLMFSRVLGVSMDWLCGAGEDADYLK